MLPFPWCCGYVVLEVVERTDQIDVEDYWSTYQTVYQRQATDSCLR